MTHFTCMVFLPAAAVERKGAEEAMIEALAPFDENKEIEPYIDQVVTPEEVAELRERVGESAEEMSDIELLKDYHGGEIKIDDTGSFVVMTTYNPLSKWDWYSIGGRFNPLPMKDGSEASQGWIKDLDLETGREEARRKAEDLYTQFEEATAGIDVPDDWETVRLRHGDSGIDAAREEYRNTPFYHAITEKLDRYYWFSNPHEHFFIGKGGREAFVKQAVGTVARPYAYLSLEGRYVSKGDMGWFGMSSGDSDTWEDDYWAYFNSLPEDTYFLMMDLHI